MKTLIAKLEEMLDIQYEPHGSNTEVRRDTILLCIEEAKDHIREHAIHLSGVDVVALGDLDSSDGNTLTENT